jgi:phosphopantothenoylcysteine decarboxylase/phosphopantothenate--cysteine ligase
MARCGETVERFRWDLGKELPGDRHLSLEGDALLGCRVALLICGGIAAYRSPDLIRGLRRQGAEVQVYATPEALRFVTKDVLEWSSLNPLIVGLDGRAQHVEDGRGTDLYMLVPATYSTLNKFALGLADNAVTTTLATALGRMQAGSCRVQVVPTMHGSMLNDVLRGSLARLNDLGVEIIAPRPGAGKANIPSVESLVDSAARGLAGHASHPDLRNLKVLITGGPTPVPIDAVRMLSNRFSGATAIAIAQDFYRAGAQVKLLLSGTNLPSPSWIPTQRVDSFDAYRQACAESPADLGIFSAAVADYQLSQRHHGKLPSGQDELKLTLVPTQKVVSEWRKTHPDSKLISFKLEAGLSDQELIDVARARVGAHSDLVVANHASGGELLLVGESDEQRVERQQLGRKLVAWVARR